MDDALAQLEAAYCPPLDPALLSAILSDYDLNDEHAVQDARNTLDQLKESALLEEEAGFDPSGTGAQDGGFVSDVHAKSATESSAMASWGTDVTSLSNDVSSVDLNDPNDTAIGDPEELERLDDETKIKLLQELFGESVSKYSIQHTLSKCSGRWQAAMEELLNHVYFDQAELSDDGGKIAAKGIDAFSEDNTARRGRKGKAKGRRFKALDERRSSSLPVSSGESSTAPANKWQSATEDIEFISSRIRIPGSTVSSTYYECGASVPKTIGALLKASMDESRHIVTDDAAVTAGARKLGLGYPTISPDYMTVLIRLTHPSLVAAQELAVALTTKPKDGDGGGLEIIPRYQAPADAESWQTAAKKARISKTAYSSEADDGFAASREAAAYASARATAFSQASAAHRKAKSNRLMGGAAAYYGQVGREYAALSSGAAATAADELAAAQSTSATLDLHGVDVLNAVRIALEKVEQWWDELGEKRVNGRIGAEDRQAGYSIVVGLGRHSEGGKGKLGPAVSKALRQHGWRVEVAGAVLVAKGRQR